MRTIALLLAPMVVWAAAPLTVRWSMLPGLCADREIVVKLTTGTKIEGRLLRVAPASFSMEVVYSSNPKDVSEGVHTLDRARFQSLRYREKRIRGRIWGMLLVPVIASFAMAPMETKSGDAPGAAAPIMLLAIGTGYMTGRAIDRRTYPVTILPDEPGLSGTTGTLGGVE